MAVATTSPDSCVMNTQPSGMMRFTLYASFAAVHGSKSMRAMSDENACSSPGRYVRTAYPSAGWTSGHARAPVGHTMRNCGASRPARSIGSSPRLGVRIGRDFSLGRGGPGRVESRLHVHQVDERI